MHLYLTARPSNSRRAAQAAQRAKDEPPRRVPRLLALVGALLATFALSASPALANAGKILVFTGTAGTLNPSSADAVARSRRSAPPTTSPSTPRPARRRSTPRTSRTIARSCSSTRRATSSTPPGDRAAGLRPDGGGGFVGIGETALLEQGGAAFFNTLTRPLGAPRIDRHRRLQRRRTSSSSTACTRRRAQLPLVSARARPRPGTSGPRTRRARSTPSRASAATRCPDGTSVHQRRRLALHRRHGNAIQPQLDRAAAWCRDVQQGRSFYTELGSTAASVADADVKQAPARRDPVGRRHGPRRLQGRRSTPTTRATPHHARRTRRPRRTRTTAR